MLTHGSWATPGLQPPDQQWAMVASYWLCPSPVDRQQQDSAKVSMAFLPVTITSVALITPPGDLTFTTLYRGLSGPFPSLPPWPNLQKGVKGKLQILALCGHLGSKQHTPGWTFLLPKQPSYWCCCLVAKSCLILLWHQAPLSTVISWSLLKFMSTELVMPSNQSYWQML